MSPRSIEFMDQARDRVAIARELLAGQHFESAVSSAYYAMLYAARAALSERDEYARTHSGTWHLFHDRYVSTGAFDQDLHALAHRAQETREGADYEAITPERSRTEEIVNGSTDFVAAVEQMLDATGEESSVAEKPSNRD